MNHLRQGSLQGITAATNQMEFQAEEGRLTKQLYRLIAGAEKFEQFVFD
jgi:hypothetical protein